jgi:hypothetical protein
MSEHTQSHKSLADRRGFIRQVVLGAGVAFGAPAILSVVRPSDLSAQVSGGGRPVEAENARDRITGQEAGQGKKGRGRGRGRGLGQR